MENGALLTDNRPPYSYLSSSDLLAATQLSGSALVLWGNAARGGPIGNRDRGVFGCRLLPQAFFCPPWMSLNVGEDSIVPTTRAMESRRFNFFEYLQLRELVQDREAGCPGGRDSP